MENQEHSKKSKRLTIAIIVLGVIVIALVVDKLVGIHKTDVIISQLEESNIDKQNLSDELKGIYVQYEKLRTNNDSINQKLEVEKQKIEELIVELKNVKSSNFKKIDEYKKEVTTLRQIMRSYIVQIDSLHTKNKLLMAENTEVKSKYKDVLIRNEDLSTERDSLAGTVGRASTLKTINLLATGINIRGKETQWIDKLDKIKVCFTVDENEFAPKGRKMVYLRIAKPDKYVLNESEFDLFDFEGAKIAYTAKREIDFSGDKLDLCIYWKKSQELQPGLYYVDIFADGKRIGTIAFTLK
jgi:biopolymer transport protein ExbB/TolQ